MEDSPVSDRSTVVGAKRMLFGTRISFSTYSQDILYVLERGRYGVEETLEARSEVGGHTSGR